MTSAPPRICFSHIAKAYSGVRALDDVSFAVRAGCVHALVGENGAGKSTLMKILAGAVAANSGEIEIDGQLAHIDGPRAAQDLGVAIVYQEFNLAPHLSVAENVFLGRWPHRWSGLIDFGDLFAQAEALFEELGLDVPVRLRVESLSVAQQQMVEIAKAVSLRARILVLDEPSAVLTPRELTSLFRVIRAMTARGVSVLYISHRLDEVFELADFVTVLRDGRHISTKPIGEITRETLIADTVGRSLETEFPSREVNPGQVVLELKNASAGKRFREVSFDVRAGEVFVLTGMVGSGRSSVARAIFGDVDDVEGTIRLGDRHGPFASPRAAQAAGVAYVPEDRKRDGLLLARAIRENITLAHRGESATFGFIQAEREQAFAGTLMKRLDIRGAGMESFASSLSGGNQQKVLLARWLARPYPVIILDEPTRGVDVGAKVEIYRIINDLAARGAAVLMISSELPEVIGMADRIGVMCRGRLMGIRDNRKRDVTQDAILRLAVGEADA